MDGIRNVLVHLATASLLSIYSGMSFSVDIATESTFVVVGKDGQRIARALVSGEVCPMIKQEFNSPADGTLQIRLERMKMRVPADKPEQQPSIRKKAYFPVSTCEMRLPDNIIHASINGQALPLKRQNPRRIAVIGDTGCVLRGDKQQACNNPQEWPFPKIAEKVAEWDPDLVIHLGDYPYRDRKCPDGNPGCAGRAWGYGYDGWREDFIEPAAPIFRRSPVLFVRGDHEICSRGGRGWRRLFDHEPFNNASSCDDPYNDHIGNYSDPYRVWIGLEAQLIVADVSNTGFVPPKNDKNSLQRQRYQKYRDLYTKLIDLANSAPHNIVLLHTPILGFSSNSHNPHQPYKGNEALQSIFLERSSEMTHAPGTYRLFPDTVHLVLSGDFHSWEQISFSSPDPSQIVAGHSGALPHNPLPNLTALMGLLPSPYATIENIHTWHGFGYMTMTRQDEGADFNWNINVLDKNGHVVKRCRTQNRHSNCWEPSRN